MTISNYHVTMLQESFRPLFWDVDLTTFNPAEFPQYTIERVLELGNEDAVAWLRRTFSQDLIVTALRASRQLSPRSANFWALIMDVPREQVHALRTLHQ